MIEAKKRLRIIVCGTNFGRIYLSAIAKLPEEYELVGILARGSDHSAACARQYGVPLYTDINQLPYDDIDVACVVVRSSVVAGQGTELANNLLMRGIHVIQEQPVHHDEVAKCLRTAYQSGCHYYLNSFYPDVEPVHRFILTARQALRKSEAIYIDAACSMHVLFPLVDILGQSLGGFRPWSFSSIPNGSKTEPLTSLCGQIRGVPITLRVQNQINPGDPDNYTYLLHRIVLCTNNGSLMLTESYGLVLWIPRTYIPRRKDGVLDLYGSHPFLNLPAMELVEPFQKRLLKSVFTDLWPEAVKRVLRRFRQIILSGKHDKNLGQYQLTACRVWENIAQQLGPAQIISPQNPQPLALADIQDVAMETKTNIFISSNAYVESVELYDIISDEQWKIRREAIVSELKTVPVNAGPVIDVGAGTGQSLKLIAETLPTAQIIAIEPSAVMRVALMSRIMQNKKLRQQVTVFPGRFQDIVLPERLAAVTIFSVIGFFDESERQEMWGLLAKKLDPNGVIIVDVMMINKPQPVSRRQVARMQVGSHFYEAWMEGTPIDDKRMRFSYIPGA